MFQNCLLECCESTGATWALKKSNALISKLFEVPMVLGFRRATIGTIF